MLQTKRNFQCEHKAPVGQCAAEAHLFEQQEPGLALEEVQAPHRVVEDVHPLRAAGGLGAGGPVGRVGTPGQDLRAVGCSRELGGDRW